MRCIECGGTLVKTNEPIMEKLRGHEFTLTGIEHEKCERCGGIVFSAKSLKEHDALLWNECRKLEGLLSPEEIKTLRESLGLTQKEFEALLGVSLPTVSRWETGKAVQSKMADNFIRALMVSPGAVGMLKIRAEIEHEPIVLGNQASWEARVEEHTTEVNYA